jgi:hypothetical protein
VRRVRIEAPEWAGTQDDCEADRLQADEEILSVEQYLAEERELLLAEDREAERGWRHETAKDEDDGPVRERDLEAVGLDGARKPGRMLTEQERRAQEWADIPRRPMSPYIDVGEAIVELWHGDEAEHEAEALGIQRAERPRDDCRSDSTDKLLRKRDPNFEVRREASEISKELLRRLFWAFQLEGQADEAQIADSIAAKNRIAFGSRRGGRPNAECRTIRRALRDAIADLYEESRHDLLAAELGCSTQALHGLMTKP